MCTRSCRVIFDSLNRLLTYFIFKVFFKNYITRMLSFKMVKPSLDFTKLPVLPIPANKLQCWIQTCFFLFFLWSCQNNNNNWKKLQYFLSNKFISNPDKLRSGGTDWWIWKSIFYFSCFMSNITFCSNLKL